MLRLTMALVLAVSMVGCGGGSDDSGGGGGGGGGIDGTGIRASCNTPPDQCNDFSGVSGGSISTLTLDLLHAECTTEQSGTWSTSVVCPTASRYGTCTFTVSPGGGYSDFQIQMRFYSALADGEAICTINSGTWTPN